MKITIPLILILLFSAVLPLRTEAAGADGGASVVLDTAGGREGTVGGKMTVQVKALGSVNLLGIQASVHYDPAKLKLRADGIAAAAPFVSVGRTDADGLVAVPFINKSPSEGAVASLSVATFTFDVLAEGETGLWLSGIKAVDQSYREIQANTETAPIVVALKKSGSPGGTPSPTPSPNPTPDPGGHPSPSPGTNPTPDPGGHPSPSPGTNPTPDPGGHPSPSPDTNPTPDPGGHPGPGPGANPGPDPGAGSGSGPVPASGAGSASGGGAGTAGGESAVLQVGVADLQLDGGQAVIALPAGASEAALTADAVRALEDGKLAVKNGEASIAIDGRNLRALLALVADGSADDAVVTIRLSAAADESLTAGAPGAPQKDAAAYRLESNVYELELYVTSAEGKEYRLASFDWPVALTLPYDGAADRDLLGLYAYDKTARDWIYVPGGRADDGSFSAALAHFSEYAVFSYAKRFADVPADRWYARSIGILAARHIVDGTDETHFMPNAGLTRAQFAALLARALRLESAPGTSFADVAPGAWYAEAAAAAGNAGLIEGLDGGIFAPGSPVTREQMAVIAMRAAQMSGLSASAAQAAEPFRDDDSIAPWAKEAVAEARSAGLMTGLEGRVFGPKQTVTRAQAAAVLANLLRLAE